MMILEPIEFECCDCHSNVIAFGYTEPPDPPRCSVCAWIVEFIPIEHQAEARERLGRTMIREQLTDQERTVLIEVAVHRLGQLSWQPPPGVRDDLVTALSKIIGTDTKVIVMRAHPSLAERSK